MSTAAQKMTADEFLDYAATHGRCELIEGEVRSMSPASIRHGIVAGRLFAELYQFVTTRNLGHVTAAETGFVVDDADTVIAPDVAYIPKGRLAASDTSKFGRVPPDFVAEVLSPSDRATAVSRKVEMWLKFGVPLVWVVDPDAQTATAYESTDRVRIYRRDETLLGGSVLPGFQLPLQSLFTF